MHKSNLTLLIILSLGILRIMFAGPALSHESATPSNSLSPLTIVDSNSGKLHFSKAEQDWLAQNHVVRVRVGDYAPIQFFNKKPSGIAVDYFNAISEKIGIQVEYQMDIPWMDALNQMRNHKGVDLLLGAMSTEERRKYLTFTDVYLSFPSVIFTREDSDFVSSLQDLSGKIVAVQNKLVIHGLLVEKYPDLNLLPKETEEDALHSLATGESDAYVGNLTVGTFYIQSNCWHNVKVAAPTGFDPQNLSMAVRSDWPELVQIINKALNTFTPVEHATLRSKWSAPIRYEYGISKVDILKWILAISIFSLTIIIVILIWNRKLKKEVIKRQKSEASLKKSEDMFRSAFQTSPNAITITNTDDGTYIDVNDGFTKMLGYSQEDVIGKSSVMLNIWNDSKDRERLVSGLNEYGIVENLEADFIGKEGQIKTGLMSANLLNIKNQNILLAVTQDLTQIKQAEKEKIKAQKIAGEQKKLALVGQVAGKMAHDFNNILGIIMGNTELSIMDCKDAEIKKTLELIFEQTIRGKNLTKNLVAFAKNQEPNQEFFRINEKIDLVLNLMKRDLEGISLIKDDESNVPDLLADPGMIEHTLVNLIQNSIHATSMSTYPRITMRTYCLDDNICFEIEDNGCGISKNHLEKIYEPAFTMKGSNDVTNSYKAGIKGTGYGMSNVKKYIGQHKGSISVKSESGSGTKFTISLPVIRKELTNKEKAEIKEENICFDKSILLVEDEPAISGVQYRLLSQEPCNHRVDIANDGQVALDLFDRNNYDFVSLDYVLPGKFNGMDVYDHIRKTNKTIPILFVSGNIEFLESIKDLKHKDTNIDHLSKPCQNKEYVRAINDLLGEI